MSALQTDRQQDKCQVNNHRLGSTYHLSLVNNIHESIYINLTLRSILHQYSALMYIDLWIIVMGLIVTMYFGLPNINFGIPNLDFGIPNLDFGTPNLDFGIPNLDFGMPNLYFGIPNLVGL